MQRFIPSPISHANALAVRNPNRDQDQGGGGGQRGGGGGGGGGEFEWDFKINCVDYDKQKWVKDPWPSQMFCELYVPVTQGNKSIAPMTLTKEANYQKAKEATAWYKGMYKICAKERKSKGKKVWPHKEKRYFGTPDCRDLYMAWKKWEQKAASNALAQMGKEDRQGTLTKEERTEYEKAMAAPTNTTVSEYNEAMKEYEETINKLQQRTENQDKTIEELRNQAGPAPTMEMFSPEWEGEGTDYTFVYLGVGALALLGGGAGYMIWKKRKARKGKA